ncbi:XRE family transcriptional regulator [Lactiplantibacillus garii]|uniref:XRE family transcriptional regulator n=1 Tax=Lactiplantibacillus garii TaxID=2306423 RepID=A0A3R8L1S9_9LACO|nr:helix-turn-helix transcriptional regulator [Lactiplantibacillus garii]RRK10827.1 XRE family transcriptional regulator [Lactiplantibacillus garii]
MEKLGVTVHQIRLAKGLTQQEVYGGIVSRSFANRFEHGQNDIGASKLFMVLDNLGVSADELRFIQRGYQPTELDQALAQTRAYYEQLNFPALATWVREHRNSPTAHEQLVASYNNLLLRAYDHKHVQLTPTTQVVYDHLLNTETWTLQELKLIDALVPLIASKEGLAALSQLTAKVEKNCRHYLTRWGDPWRTYEILLDYYGTLFQVDLNYQNFAAAKRIKVKLDYVAPASLTWDGRLVRQIWLGIWALFFGDAAAGQATIDEVLALERRYRPTIDNTLYQIVAVRTKQARAYRQKR